MNQLTRRQFLKLSVAAGAALPLARFGKSAHAESGALPRRMLGKTGESVTILGVGGAYVGHDENRGIDTKAIVEAALEGGVRLFETARSYGNSEESLGPLLKGVRDEIFIATKLDSQTVADAEKSLHDSLRALQTDHVDLLYIHAVGARYRHIERIIGEDGILAYLRKVKRDGLTRFIGMTIHPPHNYAQEVLEATDDLDVAMPYVNYMMPATVDKDQGDIIGPCRRKGLGLMAMKVLGGDGQLASDYDLAFRYALSTPGVDCASIGMKNVAEVQRAVRAAREFRPLTQEEMKRAEELGAELVHKRETAFLRLERHFARDFGTA